MKKLDNTKTTFTFNGVTYTETKTGYCYKTTGGTDKKGQPLNMRIGRHVFELAFEEYTRLAQENAEIEEWEDEANREAAERAAKQEKSDREAEAKINGKKKPEVTVEGMWDGDCDVFTVKVDGEVVLRSYSHEEAVEEARKYGWKAPEEREDEKKAEPKTKKAAKPRRSKDVAFEMDTLIGRITLTAKQVDFIHHLPDTCFWENGLDSTPWCDVLTDEIGGQFAGKPMTVGAMISTLREKKLIEVGVEPSRQGKPKFLVLTEVGKAVARKLGLE